MAKPAARALDVAEDSIVPGLCGEALVALLEGRASEQEYWQAVLKRTQWATTPAEPGAMARAVFRQVVPGMPELIRELTDYRLVLFSDHAREWMADIDRDHEYNPDDTIVSSGLYIAQTPEGGREVAARGATLAKVNTHRQPLEYCCQMIRPLIHSRCDCACHASIGSQRTPPPPRRTDVFLHEQSTRQTDTRRVKHADMEHSTVEFVAGCCCGVRRPCGRTCGSACPVRPCRQSQTHLYCIGEK